MFWSLHRRFNIGSQQRVGSQQRAGDADSKFSSLGKAAAFGGPLHPQPARHVSDKSNTQRAKRSQKQADDRNTLADKVVTELRSEKILHKNRALETHATLANTLSLKLVIQISSNSKMALEAKHVQHIVHMAMKILSGFSVSDILCNLMSLSETPFARSEIHPKQTAQTSAKKPCMA